MCIRDSAPPPAAAAAPPPDAVAATAGPSPGPMKKRSRKNRAEKGTPRHHAVIAAACAECVDARAAHHFVLEPHARSATAVLCWTRPRSCADAVAAGPPVGKNDVLNMMRGNRNSLLAAAADRKERAAAAAAPVVRPHVPEDADALSVLSLIHI